MAKSIIRLILTHFVYLFARIRLLLAKSRLLISMLRKTFKEFSEYSQRVS